MCHQHSLQKGEGCSVPCPQSPGPMPCPRGSTQQSLNFSVDLQYPSEWLEHGTSQVSLPRATLLAPRVITVVASGWCPTGPTQHSTAWCAQLSTRISPQYSEVPSIVSGTSQLTIHSLVDKYYASPLILWNKGCTESLNNSPEHRQESEAKLLTVP